jgi:hypothetical protein
VLTPVGKVTLVAVDDHEAAGSRKPLPFWPRKKLPLCDVATVHSPYTPVPFTACTVDMATAAVRDVARRLAGNRMAR